MSEKQSSLDLSSLESDYDIVGEVKESGGIRTFSATRKTPSTKRRDDMTGVMISVVPTPPGDEGNALAHLASDTKILSQMQHRRMMPVLEGRWLGDNAFAVITQRTTDATLADKLAGGEEFTNPRVAAILREVNGLLEWARSQNIVHRHVTADRIFLEPKTDRVRVRFGVEPIARLQTTDAETEDARTIVRLAMAMMIGVDDPKLYDEQCLTDMRADLPKRLCDATTELLDPKRTHTAADVTAYLAMIGMADPLFLGEEEEKRIRADVLEEQRVEREKLANERAEAERKMADERAAFEKQMAAERAKLEKAAVAEREKLEKERAELTKVVASERDKLQKAVIAERAALAAKRAELEKAVADQRAQLERTATEDRKQIEKLRAELKHAGELEIERKRDAALADVDDAPSELDEEIYAAPGFIPPTILPLNEMVFEDTELLTDDKFEVAPVDRSVELPELYEDPEPEPVKEEVVAAPVVASEAKVDGKPVAGPDGKPDAKGPPLSDGKKKWIVPVSVASVIAILGAGAIAIGSRNTHKEPVKTPVPVTVPKQVVASAPRVRTLPDPAVPLPSKFVVDSSGGSVAVPFDTARYERALERARRPKPKPVEVEAEQRQKVDTVNAENRTFGDSVFSIPSPPRPRQDSVQRRDTTVRRDTVVRPDTIPRRKN